MRRVAVLLMVVVFFLALANPSPGVFRDLPALFPIKQQGKWGYIDRTGKVVVFPQFNHARKFSEGLAAIEVCSGWGYIDRSGKLVWQTTDPCDQWGQPLNE